MQEHGIDPELVARIAATTGLTASEGARVVEDVLAWYAEPVEDYVRRRHASLRAAGHRNDAVYARIVAELRARVVAAPVLTERQVRRIVTG
ncbi:hypothetical protein [Isoptericola sediminis]|uniref:Uncharacterized protein n=1 Tax=Isoptericola sediminis TaxID=2733572 RepID=A0A849K4L9_9MICO|nr:hypothetical protein [Isoptericola sediminis]NNU26735.1 hypothetical protein [Isoptericola sediminis]